MERIKNRNGFTLIEVIAVLVVMGVLVAVISARYFDVASINVSSEADVVKSHIRYAQARSMNTNTVWGINISSGTQYSLFTNGSTASPILLPGQNAVTVTLPNGISFAAAGVISFDSWGKPYTDAGATSAQSGTRTITLSSGSYTLGINISPNTGYIP